MQTPADLVQARALLETENHAIVFVRQGVVLAAGDRRGVIDLLTMAETLGTAAAGASVADRVVGRAAALVYRALGVRAVYAQLLSDGGANALADGGVHAEWGTRVAQILNRTHNGICPFEEAAAGVSDPAEAIPLFKARLATLMANR